MLALAGIPLGLSFRFLDPPPTRPRRRWGSCSSASTTTRTCSTGSPTGCRRHLRVRERPGRRRASGSARFPRAARARGVAGPARREAALPPARDPDAEVRRRGRCLPRDPEDTPARLRRQGTAPGRDMAGVRPRRMSWRSASRSTASCRCSPFAAPTARRASTRSSRTFTRTGSCARRAPRRAMRRRPRPRSTRRGCSTSSATSASSRSSSSTSAAALLANEIAPRVHNTGPLDDRRRGDEPVREPPARRARAAARLDRDRAGR